MGASSTVCEVCRDAFDGIEGLARHFVAEAAASDIAHVMWLNRTVTKHQVEASELAVLLGRRAEGQATGEKRVRR